VGISAAGSRRRVYGRSSHEREDHQWLS
jgi:hypothetical protein